MISMFYLLNSKVKQQLPTIRSSPKEYINTKRLITAIIRLISSSKLQMKRIVEKVPSVKNVLLSLVSETF